MASAGIGREVIALGVTASEVSEAGEFLVGFDA